MKYKWVRAGLVLVTLSVAVTYARSIAAIALLLILAAALFALLRPERFMDALNQIAGSLGPAWKRALHRATRASRHRPAFKLLNLLAHADNALSRTEVDIIADYTHRITGRIPDDLRKELRESVPSMNERHSLLIQTKRLLDEEERRHLAETILLLMGTKRRHAPTVQEWYDDTLRQLEYTPAPHPSSPFDISPV